MIQDAEQKYKITLSDILLMMIGFFATWGEGMQHVSSRISLVFPALVSIYIVFDFSRFQNEIKKRQVVPKEFKWLFTFVVIHTLIYVAFNINTIEIGSEAGTANDEGFAYGNDNLGNIIIRYFLFLVFCVFLTIDLGRINKLYLFALSYVLGFIATFFLGAFHDYSGIVRISGGLRDPNAMAFDALVAFVFSLFLFRVSGQKSLMKFLLGICITIEIIAVLLSFSRGAYLALGIWFFLYLYRKGLVRNIWKIAIIVVILLVAGNWVMNFVGIDTSMVEARFSMEEMRESKGANRGYIWTAYLSKADTYFVTGMGMGNSPKVMIGNKQGVAETYESHNLYIQFFAEYGFLGLLLYLLYWKGFVKTYRETRDDYFILISIGVLFMVVTFFLNIDKGRTFWIVLAIVNMVWMRNIGLKRSKEVVVNRQPTASDTVNV